ncbi:MAG: hypothetical protein RR487_04555 [Acinetobacter sp.]
MLTNPGITDPRIVKLMNRLNPKSYQGFVDFLYADLDGIFREIQASRKLTVKKYPEIDSDDQVFKVFEDDINTQIVRDLKLLNYDAVHDKFDNGHVDIHVEVSGFPFKWLGESKIWKGVTKIEGGFKQLLEDYSTGEDNANCGGVLIFAVDTEYNTNQMLKIWYSDLEAAGIDSTRNQNLQGLTLNWPNEAKNVFYSSQIHPHSGLAGYTVRHCILNLKSK